MTATLWCAYSPPGPSTGRGKCGGAGAKESRGSSRCHRRFLDLDLSLQKLYEARVERGGEDAPVPEGLKVKVLHFKEHGGKVVTLVDEKAEQRGKLVWRVAAGYTAEICHLQIHREEDRRRGWGTLLLREGLADISAFFAEYLSHTLRSVFLFTRVSNTAARAFYRACGFQEAVLLKDFFGNGDDGPGDPNAVLCVMNLQQ